MLYGVVQLLFAGCFSFPLLNHLVAERGVAGNQL